PRWDRTQRNMAPWVWFVLLHRNAQRSSGRLDLCGQDAISPDCRVARGGSAGWLSPPADRHSGNREAGIERQPPEGYSAWPRRDLHAPGGSNGKSPEPCPYRRLLSCQPHLTRAHRSTTQG